MKLSRLDVFNPGILFLSALVVLFLIGFWIERSKQESALSEQFVEWDVNGDKTLTRHELPLEHQGDFEWADINIDGELSPEETLDYLFSWGRIVKGKESLPTDVRIHEDVAYVENGHPRQKLDLYLPEHSQRKEKLPLVIWIHGGGWRTGSKEMFNGQTLLLEKGYALASVNYRLSGHATFPAQIYDCKAAVRFLRYHAAEFGLDPDKFGVWGASAGGHLAALLGTSGGVPDLEGDLGIVSESSTVQAVCEYFGPTDLILIGQVQPKRRAPEGESVLPLITQFLGGVVDRKPEVARIASPVTYITTDDPPFLIFHGDRDDLIPMNQSKAFHRLLVQSQISSELVIIPGAGHIFFDSAPELEKVVLFFDEYLK